jgi:hypothetical protein
MRSFDAFVVVFAAAFAAAFAATKVWKATKAIFIIPDAPDVHVIPDAPDVHVIPDAPDVHIVPEPFIKMSNKFVVTVNHLPYYKDPYVTVIVTFDLNNVSEFDNFCMFIKDFVKNNKINLLRLTCSNVRISVDDFYKVIANIKEDPDEWFETFVQHHADIAMFNKQANSSVPVVGYGCSYPIPGGPRIEWSFV